MLLPRFLIHLLLKQGCFEDLEPAVFCFPLVEGRARDPVAPPDFLSLGPCLVLPQHPDDLFFAEAASFHRPSPFFRRRTLPHFGGVFGVQATTDSLQREFYHFAAAVAERVIVDKRSATEAVSLELQCFTDLLEEKSILGPERQIGLLGEILFLE